MSPGYSGPDLDRMGGEALLAVLDALLGLPAAEVKQVNEAATKASGGRLRGTLAIEMQFQYRST